MKTVGVHVRTAGPSILAGLLCLAYLLTAFANFRSTILSGNQYDDAYITYRYARNLADGNGLVFNSYERTNSASSLLFTLTLASLYKAGLRDLEHASAAVGIVSALLLILCTVRLARRRARNPWLIAVFLAPLSLSGALSAWSVSGMETVFYALLLVATLLSYEERRLGSSLVLLSASLLCRPEGVLFWAAIMAAEAARTRFRLDRNGAAYLATGLLVSLAQFGFNLAYYGEAIPNTVAMKRLAAYYVIPLGSSVKNVVSFFGGHNASISIPGGLYALVVLLGSARPRRWRGSDRVGESSPLRGRFSPARFLSRTEGDGRAWSADIATSAFILMSVVSFVLGPASDYHRYMTHVLPFLALSAVTFAHGLAGRLSRSTAPGRRVPPVLAGLLLVIGTSQAFDSQTRMRQSFERHIGHQEARRKIGRWVDSHVPKHEIVLSGDVGAIAYFAEDHDFIDVQGLTTRAPVTAARAGDWSIFTSLLRRARPRWVADTGYGDGRVFALDGVRNPGTFFHGMSGRERDGLDLYGPNNVTCLEISTPDDYVFRVVRIDTALYAQQQQP